MKSNMKIPRLSDSILIAGIVGAMALSACMTSEEKKQRDEALERLKADQVARIDQAQKEEAEKKKAASEAKLKQWVNENDPYVRALCATAPGAEHQYAWDTYQVAVSTDPQHSAEAAKTGRPLVQCVELRVYKEAEFNVDAYMAAVKSEDEKRDQWLDSPVGKSYLNNLCSMSGPERQKALDQALYFYGIVPRALVTDETKARASGFAILDCEDEKALGSEGSK